jgi:ABC-2 type transport system permease protein
MSAWRFELRLLLRARTAAAALLLLMLLSTLAVLGGLREQARQQATLARVQAMNDEELAVQARQYAAKGDAGAAAYYSFHATWDPPAPASFLALGLRDTSPLVLRVRALALQAQLHEGETHNPELALLGRLDYAFVLVYLAPLLLIVLLYDLVSGERAAGRLATLAALPGGGTRLWWRRAGLRAGLAFVALSLPVLLAALWQGLPAGALLAVLGSTAAYVAVWTGLALVVAAGRWRSATNALLLVGAWALLTLVLPSLVQAAIARALPAQQGAALMLAQRQAVHGAWDEPREATLQRFFQSHPAWRDTAPLPQGFHWKWYYAFQQLGDESVAPQVAAYRQSLLARQRWTECAGWLLPSVAVQTALHRVAGTDLPAQLAYQDAIARFHARLREQLYPYLFTDQPYGASDIAQQPRFEPASAGAGVPAHAAALGLLGVVLLVMGDRALRRAARP